MRTFLLSITGAAGLALLGLLAVPGRAEHRHAAPPKKEKPYQPTLRTTPTKRPPLHDQPPTEPYRSAFHFPKEPPTRPAVEEVRDVTLYDDYFSPYYLMVPSGMTVRFTNRGRHPHTTTADWLWESGELKRGQTFSITFSRPGRYYYYCRHHGDMHGVIDVF